MDAVLVGLIFYAPIGQFALATVVSAIAAAVIVGVVRTLLQPPERN